jgi:hypothetical protein
MTYYVEVRVRIGNFSSVRVMDVQEFMRSTNPQGRLHMLAVDLVDEVMEAHKEGRENVARE